MSLKHAMAIGGAGLTTQRIRMEVITSNLTNARTTRTAEGGPYRRMQPIIVAEPFDLIRGGDFGRSLQRVRVARIHEDPSGFKLEHRPGHPDADEQGYVAFPNVEPFNEMVDMVSAARSYEAQVTLIRGIREMMQSALQILA